MVQVEEIDWGRSTAVTVSAEAKTETKQNDKALSLMGHFSYSGIKRGFPKAVNSARQKWTGTN